MRRIGLLLAVTLAMQAQPASGPPAVCCPLSAIQQKTLDELQSFLAIPNLASDTVNINRNADAIVAMFAKRHIDAKLLRIDGAPPLVVAELPAPGAKRTINFYAHYDGQPVDEKQWHSPPWSPVIHDDRIWARSAGDGKAAIVAMLAAIDALKTKPAVNLTFGFEGDAGAGSPRLGAYLGEYPSPLRGGSWIPCGRRRHQSRRRQLFFGARWIPEG